MQRTLGIARVLVARTRSLHGYLIGVLAILLLALTQMAILELLAGHVSGLAGVLMIVGVLAYLARVMRERLD